MDKEKYEQAKKQAERDLKNYPFWLIDCETSNLGYPTKWNIKSENVQTSLGKGGSEDNIINDILKRRKIDAITKVMQTLDTKSHKIIEAWYFTDNYTREELLKELNMDKNKFYWYKNRALKNL